MKRRAFISLLGGAAVAWPFRARAQQPAMPMIGFLSPTSPEGWTERLRGFRQGLKDTGYVEGERRSNTAGRRVKSIDCRCWQPIWFAGARP